MKTKKALVSILCASLLLSQIIPFSVSADTSVTTFTFSDSGISVLDGADKNYKISGTELTITDSGNYRVTGSCSNGNIKIKKNVSGVTVTLDDLTLSNETTAPIVCNKNSEVELVIENTVTLSDTVKNSEDYWTDQGYASSDTEVEDAENAVVKLKGASKVTLSGDGTLNIKANAKNGIKSGATLDNTLETELPADSSSEYFSYLTIEGITLNIDSTSVYTPKSSSSNTGSTTPTNSFGGGRPNPMQSNENYYGDAINAESCLNIKSGDINIKAGDDGIHSDYYLNIGESGKSNDDLSINISESYEGIEGAVINFYSGDVNITSSDDAVNAANSDLSKFDFAINIYGGDIYADASNGNDNDGLDSNGSINVYGGKTIALADSGGNAFDLEGNFNVEGGTLLGLGASPMDGEKLNSSTKQTWAVWSSGGRLGGGRFGNFAPGDFNMGQGGSTNISDEDKSKVTLKIGDTSYSIGSTFSGASAGSQVSVILDGSTELIETTAKVNASYITFAGDISGKQSPSQDTDSDSETKISDTDSETKNSDTDSATETTDTETVSEGFIGTFEIVGGKASITTYATHDYENGEENQNSAYAKEDKNGTVVTDGTGQINFKVIPEDGYKVASVTATDGTYKNIKTPEDTGTENVYRITKITDNLTITVTLEKIPESKQNGIYGDVDEDANITANDALMILRASAGIENLTSNQIADVDGDENITSNDALAVLRNSVGLSDDNLVGKSIEL